MSYWFNKKTETSATTGDETDKTVIVSQDTNIPDKILDIDRVCQNSVEEENKEENITKNTTEDETDNSSDDESTFVETKNPEYFKLSTDDFVYALIKNHHAVGYCRTREQAVNNIRNLARELLVTYERSEPQHDFYLRTTRTDDRILVMAEDSFMAIIRHASVRDELKIVEIPAILEPITNQENNQENNA